MSDTVPWNQQFPRVQKHFINIGWVVHLGQSKIIGSPAGDDAISWEITTVGSSAVTPEVFTCAFSNEMWDAMVAIATRIKEARNGN